MRAGKGTRFTLNRPERWEKIEKLFYAAWQMPASERESFLAG